jgi:hypothetical protein
MSNSAVVVFAMLLLCPVAITANAEESQVPAHPCATVASPAERLACYDRQFPPAVDAVTLAEHARAGFGLSRSEAVARSPGLAPPEEPERVEATVVGIAERRDGRRVITLDNGHVWLQTESRSLGSLSEGDRVEVKQGSFSSYRLITPSGVPLQVRRIK